MSPCRCGKQLLRLATARTPVDRRFQHTNRYVTAMTCSFLLPLAHERRGASFSESEASHKEPPK